MNNIVHRDIPQILLTIDSLISISDGQPSILVKKKPKMFYKYDFLIRNV